MLQEFEWDPKKKETNIQRHGIDFEDATILFEPKSEYVEHQDTRNDYGEIRWIRLSELNHSVVCVVYTVRKHKIRIISMRKANHHERKIYYRKIYKSD